MTRRISSVGAAAALVSQLLLSSPGSAVAAEPVTVTFGSTANEQSWEVPAGVTSIHVVLIGGRGGAVGIFAAGGNGARVEGDLAVTPGLLLFVEVGGHGANAAEFPTPATFNGGGAGGASTAGLWAASGGGASDLRTVSRTAVGSLESRLIVAAGGGGAGLSGAASNRGGNAGQQGGGGQTGGGPGTASAGGAGGTGDVAGQNGSLGIGGAGAAGDFIGGGGGAGGGLYGGGGGGVLSDSGGGGGGGSNYVGAATGVSVSLDDGGVPSISITYTPILDSGTVSAQVTVPSSAACLQLSTTSVDFGTLPLGAEDAPATPDVTVTNCSGVSETIFARGTDATANGAFWGLVDSADTCTSSVPLTTDTYRLGLGNALGTLSLSTSNKALESLASGASTSRTARLYTACPGSSGAGTVMTMQIVFLATE